MAEFPIDRREMKAVTVPDDGTVVSIENRRYEKGAGRRRSWIPIS